MEAGSRHIKAEHSLPERYERPRRRGRLLALLLLGALTLLGAPSALGRRPTAVSKLLRSPSYKVRLQAAIYLSRLRDPKTVKPLIRCVNRDPHYLVRAFCAVALGRIGNPTALPTLKRHRNDSNSFVRRKIRQAIERLYAQSSISGGKGYQIKYKPKARLFVVVKSPRRRGRRVSRRVARFTERALRLQLNEHSSFEVARPGVEPPRRWIKRRRIPAVAVTMTVTRIRRRRRGRTVTVIARAKAVVTRYPSKAVKLISDTEAKSTQQIKGGRMSRTHLENLYRFLERQALDGAIKRICQRLAAL